MVHEFLLRKTQMSSPLISGGSIKSRPLPNITPAIADCRFKVPLLPRLHGISIILVTYACCQGVKHFPISRADFPGLDFYTSYHCFNIQSVMLWRSFWTFSVTLSALMSNFAYRLPGIGLLHSLPLL